MLEPPSPALRALCLLVMSCCSWYDKPESRFNDPLDCKIRNILLQAIKGQILISLFHRIICSGVHISVVLIEYVYRIILPHTECIGPSIFVHVTRSTSTTSSTSVTSTTSSLVLQELLLLKPPGRFLFEAPSGNFEINPSIFQLSCM